MAFQDVPNTAEIVIKYTGAFRNMVNVLHATKASIYDLSDLTALAVAVDASVVADWLPIQDNDFTYESVTVRGLNDENDQEVLNNDGTAAGGVAGTAMPGNVTISVKKSSDFTGRTARGRLYWIGLPGADLAANKNIITPAAQTAIEDAVEAMRVAINATVWVAQIVSRFSNGSKRTFGITTPWTSTTVLNDTVDSMRSRLAD
jgi:hypothetical protein